MSERRLTLEETKILVERGILCKNDVHICIDNLSRHSTDDWFIVNINESSDTILFDVAKCSEPLLPNRKSNWIKYNKIKEISNMSIDCVLSAYELDSDKVIEIDNESDVANTIVGQTFCTYVTPQRKIDLEDGMKIIFHNDINPKYKDKVLTVKGVGESIRLVAPRGRPRKTRN